MSEPRRHPLRQLLRDEEFLFLGLAAAVGVGGVVALLGLSVQPGQSEIYSPYQSLTVHYTNGVATRLSVNDTYFQRILDLSDEAVTKDSQDRLRAGYYGIPYRVKPRPRDVLVVGAGTGNDVAAAVRAQAGRVDAVVVGQQNLHEGWGV